MKFFLFNFTSALFLVLVLQFGNAFAQEKLDAYEKCADFDAGGFSKTFDAGQYKGNYYLIKNQGKKIRCFETRTLKLSAGDYSFHVGGFDGAENILHFKVSAAGEFSIEKNDLKWNSFETTKDAVKFKTTTFQINRREYPGCYFFSPFYNVGSDGGDTGKRCLAQEEFTVVPNLKYYIEIYGRGLNDEIVFRVGDSGEVSEINNPRAVYVEDAAKRILNFRHVKIKISCSDYNGEINFGGQYISGRENEVTIVPYTFIYILPRANESFVKTLIKGQFVSPTEIAFSTGGKKPKSFVCRFK